MNPTGNYLYENFKTLWIKNNLTCAPLMTNMKRRPRKTTIKSADISYHPSCCNCIMWLMLKQLVEHKNRLTALILPRGDGDGDGRFPKGALGLEPCVCAESQK